MKFLAIFFYYLTISLTGPSTISVEINPIGENSIGDVLCRTRFNKNVFGAHRHTDVFYGYAIVKSDTILEFRTDSVIVPVEHDWELIQQQISNRDSIFNGQLVKQSPTAVERKLIQNFILFTRKNKSIQATLEDLSNHLESDNQRSLKNSMSLQYNSRQITIVAETKKFLFVENHTDYYADGNSYGAEFNYKNILRLSEERLEDVGFDIQDVTGILNKK